MIPIEAALGKPIPEVKAILRRHGRMATGLLPCLWHRQGGRCFYCDEMTDLTAMVGPLQATRDHLFKRCDRDKYPPSIKDMSVMACRECNSERGHLAAHEYIGVHAERWRRQHIEIRMQQ